MQGHGIFYLKFLTQLKDFKIATKERGDDQHYKSICVIQFSTELCILKAEEIS